MSIAIGHTGDSDQIANPSPIRYVPQGEKTVRGGSIAPKEQGLIGDETGFDRKMGRLGIRILSCHPEGASGDRRTCVPPAALLMPFVGARRNDERDAV